MYLRKLEEYTSRYFLEFVRPCLYCGDPYGAEYIHPFICEGIWRDDGKRRYFCWACLVAAENEV